MRHIVLFFIPFLTQINSVSQQKVAFYSSDSIKITADLYKSSSLNPYVILFHQEDGSRGEFNEIAPRIRKLGYNCLAVDLRYGNKNGFINNETKEFVDSLGIKSMPYDALKDIIASINFAYNQNHKPVILLGSSYSASLCLLAGKNSPRVIAVIAFSPGEFFGNQISVKDSLHGFNKPLFLGSSSDENIFLSEMTKEILATYKTIFTPATCKGLHGANCLTNLCSCKDEYWLALLLFFRELEY